MTPSTRKKSNKIATPAKKDKVKSVNTVAPLELTTPPRTVRATKNTHTVVQPSPIATPVPEPKISLSNDPNVSAANYFAVAHKQDAPVDATPTFDFKVVGLTAVSKKARGHDKNSTIRCAVIPSEAILFRIQSNDPAVDAWTEKLFYDDCKPRTPEEERKNPRPQWVTDLNIDDYIYKWYDNNEPKLNNKGYGIRLFAIYISNPIEEIATIALDSIGQHIATMLSNNPKNNTVATCLSGDEYYWNRNATWAELIGEQAALQHLQYQTSNTFYEGFYQQYTTAIHRHFRKCTLSVELACNLHAPISQILPSALRAASTGTIAATNSSTAPNMALAPDFNLPPESDAEDPSVVDLQNNGDDISEPNDEDDECNIEMHEEPPL